MHNVAIPAHSAAFSQLYRAVENAFRAEARPATVHAIQSLGLKIEDIERVVGSVLVDYLPGGAHSKGNEFVTSALSLYQALGQEERQEFQTFYEDVVAQGKWKVVEPVLPAGIAPALDPSNIYSAAERYRIELQWGGFKRTAFVDVGEMKRQQLRKSILDYAPSSSGELVSKEMRIQVGTYIQQHLSAGISISPNAVLTWN
jgi:hypothetical protein